MTTRFIALAICALVISFLVLIAVFAADAVAQEERFYEVYKGKYFVWYVDDYVYSRWEVYAEKLKPFFSYADVCYEALFERLGVKPKTPMYIVVAKKFRGGAFAAGIIGEIGKGPGIGIADDAFLGEAYGIDQYWAYVLILHEMINLFTGYVTSEWPRAWWADHRSPFPCMVVENVLRELGYDEIAIVHFMEQRYDPLLVMFHRLRRDFGWEMFIRMFRKMMELGVDLTEYPQDPGPTEISLEKANAVYYFLMYGAREDITEYLVEAGLPPPSPELMKKLEDRYGLGVYGTIYKPSKPAKYERPYLILVCAITPPVDKVVLILEDGSRVGVKVASEEVLFSFLGVEAQVIKIIVPLPALGKKVRVAAIELWHVIPGYEDPTAIIVRDLEGEHYYRVWSHSYYLGEGYYVDVLKEIEPSPVVLSTSLEEVTVETLEKGVARTEYSFREGRIYLDVVEIISIRFTILTNATLEEAGISGNKLSVVVSSPGRAFVKITLPDALFNRFGLSEKDVRVWVNGAEVEGGVVKRDAMGNVIDLIVEGRANVTAKFGRTLEISIVDKEGKSQFAIVYLRHRGRLLNTTYAKGYVRFIFVPLKGVEVEICRLDVTHVVRELGTTEEKVEVTLPTTKEEYLEENEKLGTMYSEVKSKYEKLVKEHSELEEEYARARKTYVEALSELEDLRNKYGKLSKELENLRKKLKDLSEELERALEEASAKIEPLHAAIYAVAAAAAGMALGFIIGRKTARR